VEIMLSGGKTKDDSPYFRRRFTPAETEEIRIYLHGGDDAVARDGALESPVQIRVIGGDGRDRLGDSLPPANLRVYDGRLTYGPDSMVEAALDRRPWTRGRGGRLEPPVTDHGSKLGPTFGATHGGPDFAMGFSGGFDWVEHGFRYAPYKQRVALTGGYSVGADAFGLMASAEFSAEDSPLFWRVSGMASDLEHPWFYGLGNNTLRGATREDNRLPHREYVGLLEIGARRKLWSVSAGPIIKYSTTDAFPAAVAGVGLPRGSGGYGQLGIRGVAEFDSRNEKPYPTRGVRLSFDVAGYPGLWDNEGAFGGGEVKAATYLSAPLPLAPVLALRAGARRMWGPYPWFEAAFLGGRSTLRGFSHDRFGGDAAVWGGGDLRLKLARLAVVLPMDIGGRWAGLARRRRLRPLAYRLRGGGVGARTPAVAQRDRHACVGRQPDGAVHRERVPLLGGPPSTVQGPLRGRPTPPRRALGEQLLEVGPQLRADAVHHGNVLPEYLGDGMGVQPADARLFDDGGEMDARLANHPAQERSALIPRRERERHEIQVAGAIEPLREVIQGLSG
jgi:hypothetical protein